MSQKKNYLIIDVKRAFPNIDIFQSLIIKRNFEIGELSKCSSLDLKLFNSNFFQEQIFFLILAEAAEQKILMHIITIYIKKQPIKNFITAINFIHDNKLAFTFWKLREGQSGEFAVLRYSTSSSYQSLN
ncbi:unnamed protein product [Paramecium octaurelia]|uniref:Uncharacterized protein n=1 Tax=Paramecium octaurelia TaxID=43137 RepID=A0A8S1YRH9_PAROT|nr:unnamed protein product [Paramecium octaurelia]